MKYITFFSLFLLLNLAACSPLQTYVKTDTTTFYKDSFAAQGSIVVLPGDVNLNNSLEFDLYRQKVEAKLLIEGFSIADNLASADFAALLLFAVDDGKQSIVYSPIYGQSSRLVNSYADIAYDADGKAVVIRRNYLSPSLGVVGASAKTQTNFRHTVALDIVKADSLGQEKPAKVFEIRTISTGDCAVIVEVFDELIEAMFVEFPGENGRNRRDTIESVTNCP
jgi:hypothetical protein